MPDILLVEDKDSLRRVLRLTLENAGYSVTEAADARAAFNEIAAGPHKLVLTDLRMPHGSGLDVLRAARAADGSIPVIVMTAFGSIDEAVQAMKDGAHDFLQKPVDSNHLLLIVERALEQERLRTENILLREEWSRRYGFPRIIGESEAIKRRSLKLSASRKPKRLSCCSANRAPAKSFSRAPSIISPAGATGPSWPSIAPPFRRRLSKTNCLAMSAARLPARATGGWENLNLLRAVRFSLMKLVNCRWPCRETAARDRGESGGSHWRPRAGAGRRARGGGDESRFESRR